MSKKVKSVLDAVLALSAKDREVLLNRLLASLPPPPTFAKMTKDEFAAELLRRDREMEDGVDVGLPWSQVRKLH